VATADSDLPRAVPNSAHDRWPVGFWGALEVGARGFPDTTGTGAWDRALFAFGAAIAQMRHGAYGYAIPSAIETVRIYGGLTGDSKILADLGTKFPDNLRSPARIDAAIDKAVRFNAPNPDQGVRGSGGDDLGLVDYARLSFGVFGYRFRSLYILAIS